MKSVGLILALSILLSSCGINKPKEVEHEAFIINKNDTLIDCKGNSFNGGTPTEIRIISSSENKISSGVIRNCKITGSIRFIGLGRVGESKRVRESSLSLGHTERAQEEAPSYFRIENTDIISKGKPAIYMGPGTNHITVDSVKFTGYTNSMVIYMDAESGYNIIKNSEFDVTPKHNTREVIAVDGSAYNTIVYNNFKQLKYGGIYLYRNCGEGGTIRHQSPKHNTIDENTFNMDGMGLGDVAIWLGSRDGNRNYCDHDKGYDFGSSENDGDFANYNTVSKNNFSILSKAIKNNGKNNIINLI